MYRMTGFCSELRLFNERQQWAESRCHAGPNKYLSIDSKVFKSRSLFVGTSREDPAREMGVKMFVF